METNGTIRELGSWYYPVYFDYLPAFRLAVILRLPSWFRDPRHDLCSQNVCNENSICMPVFNQNNSYYCSCKRGYYGEDCHMYERHCETYCSPNALCQPNNDYLQTSKNNLYCVCPMDHFGPSCNLKYDGCKSNPCLNNASCFSLYDISGETSYECICLERFYGKQCELEKAFIRIDLSNLSTLSIHATVVQFSSRDSESIFKLFVEHQQVYKGLPLMINYDHSYTDPKLGIVKIYQDLLNSQNFLVYLSSTWGKIDVISFPPPCPHVLSLLPQGELLTVFQTIKTLHSFFF
jgi:hypothetical protein